MISQYFSNSNIIFRDVVTFLRQGPTALGCWQVIVYFCSFMVDKHHACVILQQFALTFTWQLQFVRTDVWASYKSRNEQWWDCNHMERPKNNFCFSGNLTLHYLENVWFWSWYPKHTNFLFGLIPHNNQDDMYNFLSCYLKPTYFLFGLIPRNN